MQPRHRQVRIDLQAEHGQETHGKGYKSGVTFKKLEEEYGPTAKGIKSKCEELGLWYYDKNLPGDEKYKKCVVFRDVEASTVTQTEDEMSLTARKDVNSADADALLDSVFHESAAPSIALMSDKGNEEFAKQELEGAVANQDNNNGRGGRDPSDARGTIGKS